MKTLITFILVVFIIVSGTAQDIGDSFDSFRMSPNIMVWEISNNNGFNKITYYDKSIDIECVAVFTPNTGFNKGGMCKFIFMDITERNDKNQTRKQIIEVLNANKDFTKTSENEWVFKTGGLRVIRETIDKTTYLIFILVNI